MQMKYITAAVASAIAIMSAGHAHAAQGPSSSATPYVTATAPGVEITSIISVGDTAQNGYKMVGIPDGLGTAPSPF